MKHECSPMTAGRAAADQGKRRAGSLLLASSLSVACGLLACGSAPETAGEPQSRDPVEHVGTETEALSLSQVVPPGVASLASNAADLLSGFSKVKSGVEMAFALAKAFGLIADAPSEVELLKEELDRVASSLDWKLTATVRADQWSRVDGAVIAAHDGATRGLPLTRFSPDDTASRDAVIEAGDLTMFMRLWVPSSTNGPWKDIMGNNTPELIGDGQQVFDWRLALPWLMQLTALRLQVMGAIDPAFNTDGSFNEELANMRARLQEHLERMKRGVQCGRQDRIRVNGLSEGNPVIIYDGTDIACADLNTGAAFTGHYSMPHFESCIVPDRRGQGLDQACVQALPAQQTVADIQDSYRRQLLHGMPIFQVQSMIDTLYRYMHPGPEFTETLGQISTMLTADYCLDVQWGNGAAGTPVWLWNCAMNDAQWWSYDRERGNIVNPAFGMCLEVKPPSDVQLENYYPGATVQIDYCQDPVPTWQRWTYDPESGVLQSALGTVLDIQWGNFQAGNPVWTWDRDGNWAQLWYTD